MQVVYLDSFNKDITKIKDKSVKAALVILIEEVKMATKFSEIKNLKKLKGFKTYYRIRLGDYRLGLEYINDEIRITRFLDRKDIYKYFP